MKRGNKPKTPEYKAEAGTLKKSRDGGKVTITAAGTAPVQPDFLTDAGCDVWERDAGRALSARAVDEMDSTMFAAYCNLQGEIETAWRLGRQPAAVRLQEARKMAEQFGLFGVRSRIVDGGAKKSNAFSGNGAAKL